jgi:hypothetical protein
MMPKLDSGQVGALLKHHAETISDFISNDEKPLDADDAQTIRDQLEKMLELTEELAQLVPKRVRAIRGG